MFIGILLVLFGVVMLLDRLGIIHGSIGEFFVPIALVALGASFIFKDKKQPWH